MKNVATLLKIPLVTLAFSCQKEPVFPSLADLNLGPYAPFTPNASWTYQTTDIVCGDVPPDTLCTENIFTETISVEGDMVFNDHLYKKVGRRFFRIAGDIYYEYLGSADIREGGAEIRYLRTDMPVGEVWRDTLFWDENSNAPFDFTVVVRKVRDQSPQMEVAGRTYNNILKIESFRIHHYGDGDTQVPSTGSFTWYAEGVGEIFYKQFRFNAQYERVLIDFRLE